MLLAFCRRLLFLQVWTTRIEMATVLATQLAQIRAQSTNSLDLKAQKKAHSQSLFFEPRVAATQGFDTIYQICYEGFEELCRLDPSFYGFAGSVFGEQSKQEDRTQMTAAQNQRLDLVIEEFLGLVSSRLLLKPALKAVEWLVRRFRSMHSWYLHAHRSIVANVNFHTESMSITRCVWCSPSSPFIRDQRLQLSFQFYLRRFRPRSNFYIHTSSHSQTLHGTRLSTLLQAIALSSPHSARMYSSQTAWVTTIRP